MPIVAVLVLVILTIPVFPARAGLRVVTIAPPQESWNRRDFDKRENLFQGDFFRGFKPSVPLTHNDSGETYRGKCAMCQIP